MRYIVTTHAVDQYISRVKPALSVPAARQEVERLIAALVAVEPEQAPTFCHSAADTHALEGGKYLVLTDQIAFAVKRNRITTCLIDGGLSEEGREARRQRKEHRAKRRKDRGFKQTLRGRPRVEDA